MCERYVLAVSTNIINSNTIHQIFTTRNHAGKNPSVRLVVWTDFSPYGPFRIPRLPTQPIQSVRLVILISSISDLVIVRQMSLRSLRIWVLKILHLPRNLNHKYQTQSRFFGWRKWNWLITSRRNVMGISASKKFPLAVVESWVIWTFLTICLTRNHQRASSTSG